MRRFRISPETVEGEIAIMSPEDSRHLAQVLRMKVGDPVRLFDGRDMEYEGRVAAIGTDGVRVVVGRGQPTASESPLELILLQGFLKDAKMDLLVRQLTELGISRIVPVVTRRSVARPDARRLDGRMARWRKIAAEALKQCRRGRIPVIDAAGGIEAAWRRPAAAISKSFSGRRHGAPWGTFWPGSHRRCAPWHCCWDRRVDSRRRKSPPPNPPVLSWPASGRAF